MSVQENIEVCEKLKTELEKHPMCFELSGNKHHLIMEFPYDVRGINGVRVSLSNGKASAYKVLLERAEQAWKDTSL
jgi:hypothetical protein